MRAPPPVAGLPLRPGRVLPPSLRTRRRLPPRPATHSGCLVCGSPLVYQSQDRPGRCHYCRAELTAQTLCERGHFVCDACHTAEAAAVIRHICQATRGDGPHCSYG